MELKKRRLKDSKANKEYYAKSDGNFMSPEDSLYAHKKLDRVAWVREWVYKLRSVSHMDVATKDGYLPICLQQMGVDCVGIDPSEDAIDFAKVKALMLKLDCTFIKGYYQDIPEGIHTDSVSCLELIEHVEKPEHLVQKLFSIGEYVFVSTPDSEGRHGLVDAERNQEHLRIYTKQELEELISKYGSIIESVVRDDQICILAKRSR